MIRSRHTVSSIAALIAILLLTSCRPFVVAGKYEYRYHRTLRQAENAIERGEYEQAIALYQEHLQRRLARQDRPKWENPFFYKLLIGDAYLRNHDVLNALSSYEEAEAKGVSKSFLSDRYRLVADWYERRNQLQEAIDILERFRDRDPLLFDGRLDRLAKELVRREESASTNATSHRDKVPASQGKHPHLPRPQ